MNRSITTILQGASSSHKQRARLLGSASRILLVVLAAAAKVVEKVQPPTSTAPTPQGSTPQGPSVAGPNSNPYNQDREQIEEELSMIATGALPSSCRDLAFASVHLTPSTFHEDMR